MPGIFDDQVWKACESEMEALGQDNGSKQVVHILAHIVRQQKNDVQLTATIPAGERERPLLFKLHERPPCSTER
jgi:hypothetical protein